ncbi:hypothetical protein [Nonomuraea africana]|uniref:hypothetical protein n=1 Tax=Nonomuraea africana TaxID=46171 RepID=UPI0033D8149C
MVDDACRLINEKAAAQFVVDVSTRQQQHRESLQVARRAVSSAFIESAEYFARSSTWEALRPLRKHFQDLVAGTCRTAEKPEEGADVKAALGEIESTLGEPVRDWIVNESDSYAKAKNILWRSYYANALAPELRPNDRPEMLDWIRVLAALERLRPPSDDAEWRYDEAGCVCVGRLSRARVNMPYELFAEMPPPDPAPDKPKDPVKEGIVALRASLERLDAARRDLDRLYRRKVNALRHAPPPAREQGIVEVEQPVDDVSPQPVDDVSPQPVDDASPRPPWLLTEEDAGQLPGLEAELGRLGIPLAGSLVSEVADALDKAIATNTAALTALESPVDVLGIGPTMVLARRTVRGLRPAPRGSTGNVEQAEPQMEQAEPEGQEGAP